MSEKEKTLNEDQIQEFNEEKDQSPSPQAFTGFTTFTDSELFERTFNEVMWIVPNFIPEGLTVFAGKPKVGKSLFFLALASAVARGDRFLGDIQVQQRDVLYFALEDPARRIKDILSKIQGNTGSGRIHFSTVGPKKGELTTSFLERHIEQHPEVKLIVIDTLGRFCGYKGTSSYQSSYSQLAEIKSVADKHSLAIIVIHHLRKVKADDPLEAVMGSAGITGAADTIGVLMRDRGLQAGTLIITGREVEEKYLALEFDPSTISWKSLGAATAIRMSAERQEVLELLRKENRPMKLKEIVESLGKKRPVITKLLLGLAESDLVEQPKYGFYKAVPIDGDENTNCGETSKSSETENTGGSHDNFVIDTFMNQDVGEPLASIN